MANDDQFMVGGYLSRPRLLDVLDSGVALVSISAPSGGGKTALLLEYDARLLAADKPHTLLRARGQSSAALWGQVASAAGIAIPQERGPSAEPAAEVIRQLRELKEPITVLVDDLTREHSGFLNALPELLSTAPGLRFVITTRYAGLFEQLSLRVPTSYRELTVADMLLTPEEAISVTGSDVSGVLLPVIGRLRRLENKSDNPARSAELLAYLLEAEGDSERRLQALESLSVVQGTDRSLAQRLTNDSDIVQYAADLGLGLWTSPVRFELYAEFREPLLERFRHRDPYAVERQTRLAAIWSLDSGRPLDALEAATRIRDYYLASRVLRASWESLMGVNQAVELIQAIDEKTRARIPAMNLFLGLRLYARGNSARAGVVVSEAITAIRKRIPDSDPLERFWLLALLSGSMRILGRFKPAAEAALSGLALATEVGPTLTRGEPSSSRFYSVFSISLIQVGDIPNARQMMELGIAATEPGTIAWFHLVSLAAGVDALCGNMPEAAARLRQLGETPHDEELEGGYLAYGASIASALLELEAFRPDRARAALAVMNKHFNTVEHWAAHVIVECLIDFIAGAPEDAIARIDRAIAGGHPPTSDFWAKGLATVRALMELANAGDTVPRLDGLPRSGDFPILVRALRYLMVLEPEQALESLSRLGTERPNHMPRLVASGYVLASVAADRLGKDSSTSFARRAQAIMRANELATPTWLVPAADLQRLADRSDCEPERADRPNYFTAAAPRPILSRRELTVLRELAITESRAELAERLHVSSNTIKTQIRSIYRKLGAATRSEALLRASELALLDD
ncbi:LuxR C-terminal-related transcriptional regulator [Leifsonia sp. NPDC102414]|uniref:helix-turn-helix transcriptional regulator n=1 Tax=Leifsonia sp. NPDC102414 TaxID=3364124 RepID=UPI003804933F